LGILIPPIRIRDDVRLQSNEYIVKIRGVESGRAEVMPRLLLALDTGSTLREIEGVETVDPSFGMPARWIAPGLRVDAEGAGYVVVEPSTVVATHLMESLKRHAADLLGRQDVQEMVDMLKASHPALIEEVVPAKVPLGVLHRVLQRLLKEGIPIRNLVTILETLADASEHTKDPEALTEYARRALSNVIWELHQGDDGVVRAITVGPRLEAELMRLFSPRSSLDNTDSLNPDRLTALLARLERLHKTHGEGGPLPIVTPPGLRLGVRRLVEPVFPHIPVVSLAELPPHVDLKGIASWELDNAA
ncbi:MAG: flagellar biosynthesis protein FlhA, partial [Gemmatimonadota bacterium]|nr:flagellar biosynthesis protein FlhA [Gemmatimonadota bacterium]